MQHPWISTKESLPSFGQNVLGIYKSDISRYTFEPFPGEKQPFFRPGTMLPIKHIKWWMPMITEGWHKLAEKQPEEG